MKPGKAWGGRGHKKIIFVPSFLLQSLGYMTIVEV